jgi:purine-binding chemotaxis protein CheW
MTATDTSGTAGGQYLTFVLDREQYAVDVAHTQTVLEYAEITRIPRMPEFMLGVINFRGAVLPVIDLRRKLGLPERETESRPMVIVLEVPFGDEILTLGSTADAVKEVVDIEAASIEDAPSIGTRIDTSFIRGIGKKDDEFVIILNSEKIFRDNELASLAPVGNTATE